MGTLGHNKVAGNGLGWAARLWLWFNVADGVLVIAITRHGDKLLGHPHSLVELVLALFQLAAALFFLTRFTIVVAAINLLLLFKGLLSLRDWSRARYLYHGMLVATVGLAGYLVHLGLVD